MRRHLIAVACMLVSPAIALAGPTGGFPVWANPGNRLPAPWVLGPARTTATRLDALAFFPRLAPGHRRKDVDGLAGLDGRLESIQPTHVAPFQEDIHPAG